MSIKSFRFLRWFCPEDLVEEIEGDLIQKIERDAKSFGERKGKEKIALECDSVFQT